MANLNKNIIFNGLFWLSQGISDGIGEEVPFILHIGQEKEDVTLIKVITKGINLVVENGFNHVESIESFVIYSKLVLNETLIIVIEKRCSSSRTVILDHVGRSSYKQLRIVMSEAVNGAIDITSDL